MYQNWSALDMALVLELALQKAGDIQQNVLASLKSLSEKTFRKEDANLPQALNWLANQPDPVAATRQVVDNYYRITRDLEESRYKAEAEAEDELIEEQEQHETDVQRLTA